jgi:hypothetical protein
MQDESADVSVLPSPRSAGGVPAPGWPEIGRGSLTVALKVIYLLTSGLFWISGALTFAVNFTGAARLLGLAYLPILALPLMGTESLAGFEVRGFLWWVWFAFDMILAWLLIAVNLRPDRRSRAN